MNTLEYILLNLVWASSFSDAELALPPDAHERYADMRVAVGNALIAYEKRNVARRKSHAPHSTQEHI